MFLRPFHVKSNSAVRKSESKSLREKIVRRFPNQDPSIVEALLPSKCHLDVLRLVTNAGIEVVVTFVNKEPLFFEFDDQFVPTVYTVWKVNGLLKYVYTWRPVLAKMLGGADLMLPGVCKNETGEETMRTLEKGDMCAVGVVGNRAAGVVMCLLSWKEMYSFNMKGKGFKVLHLCGDKLWELGSCVNPLSIDPLSGIPSDPSASPALGCYSNDQPVVSEMSESSSYRVQETKLESEEQVSSGQSSKGEEDASCCFSSNTEVNDSPECEDSEKAMDELLKECFLLSLKAVVKKATLPLLASTFYSAFMLPQCASLDVKKSSFKKLSRFLNKMSDTGVLKVEVNKGVESVTKIDLKHPLVKEFSPVLLSPEACVKDSCASLSIRDKEIYVMELYTPSLKLLPVFRCSGHDKSSLLALPEVRKAVRHYVEVNDLQSKDNPSVVELNATLCDGLQNKGTLYCTELTWKDLFDSVMKNMKLSHSISHGGAKALVRKGPVQPVLMTIMQRTGNKKVTIVENVEFYGIPADKLAQTAQRMAAASATVETRPGSNTILVQGIAVDILRKILQDQYGLSSKFVEVVDKLKQTSKRSRRK